MKRNISTIVAAGCLLLATLSGCGGKNKAEGGNSGTDTLNTVNTTDTLKADSGEPALYDTYQNGKYGFSIVVPKTMKCTDETPMAEGANYAIEGDEGMNMMSVIASDNYGGQAFTAEDIKAEMDNRAAELGEEPGTKVVKTANDNGWTITVEGGELYHQVYVAKYKGGRRYELTYIYDEDKAPILGGNVEKDVITSMEIK